MITPAPADPAVVERVLAETAVERTIPPPGWAAYSEVVGDMIVDLLRRMSRPFGDIVSSHGQLLSTAAAVLILVIVAALLVMAFHRLREGRGPGAAGADIVSRPAGVRRRRDAAAWRAELEQALEAGSVGPALEALWWWFACSVVTNDDVDRTSTSRELVARAGRPDLASWARDLDRWLYGARRPEIGDIRGLAARLEQVVS